MIKLHKDCDVPGRDADVKGLIARDLGAVLFDTAGALISCDDVVAAMLGVDGAASPSLPVSLDAFLERLDAAAVRSPRLPADRRGRSWSCNYWLRDGRILSARFAPLAGVGGVLTVRDATAETWRSWVHRLHGAETRTLVSAPDVRTGLTQTLHHIGRHIGARQGRLWLPAPDGGTLELGAAWSQGERARRVETTGAVKPGQGLVGRAWRTGDAVVGGAADTIAAVPAVPDDAPVLTVPLPGSQGQHAVFEFIFAKGDRIAQAVAPWVMRFCTKFGTAVSWRKEEEREAVSQRRFEDLLNTAGDAVISIDAARRIVLFNRRAEEIFGYAASEALGQPLDILLPMEARAAHGAHVEAFAKGAEARRLMGARPEVRGRRKDGSEFPAEATVSKLRVGNEMVLTVLLRDITEQHQAAEALRRSERYNRMLFEESAIGMMLCSLGGRLHDVNPAFARIIGRSVEECLALTCTDLTPAGFAEEDRQQRAKLETVGRFGPYETRYVSKSGQLVPVRLSGVAIEQDGERLVWSIVEDISERQRTLQALAIRDKAIASALTPIALADLDGRLTYANRAFLMLWGYREESEVLGRPWTSFWRDEAAALAVTDALRMAGAWVGELSARHDDQGLRDIRVSANLVQDAAGIPLCMMASFVDMTVQKANEAALRQARDEAEIASRSKSEFLAAMSHELRTPLNAIIGFSELMRMETMGPITVPRYREYLADIHESGVHLLGIINDILDISRVEAGRMTLHEEAIPVPNAVEACLRMVRERAAAAGVDLTSVLASPMPGLFADPRLFKQIVLNLLSNAVKFTPAGGRISVEAKIDGSGDFVLSVADTGIGMEEHQIAIALRPFAQLDSSLSRRFQGSGLGLPLADSFARLHGGSLTLKSAPEKGTTVSLHLPKTRLCVPKNTSQAAISE